MGTGAVLVTVLVDSSVEVTGTVLIVVFKVVDRDVRVVVVVAEAGTLAGRLSREALVRMVLSLHLHEMMYTFVLWMLQVWLLTPRLLVHCVAHEALYRTQKLLALCLLLN